VNTMWAVYSVPNGEGWAFSRANGGLGMVAVSPDQRGWVPEGFLLLGTAEEQGTRPAPSADFWTPKAEDRAVLTVFGWAYAAA